MEEKEILNEVNGSGKDKVRRILMYIGWGLSAVLLVCGIMLIEDGGNIFLRGLGSADVFALFAGVCHSRSYTRPQD